MSRKEHQVTPITLKVFLGESSWIFRLKGIRMIPLKKAKSIISKLDDKIIELRKKVIKGLDNE